MTDANTICHDLDLLDDWLAGKGYGEEAGLVLRALSLIHEQEQVIEKLRAALNVVCQGVISERESIDCAVIEGTALRAAAKALKETGE